MINESALKETLIALFEDSRTNFIMIASLTNEIAALREAVRGLDPTFADVLEQKRDEREAIGTQKVESVLAGYDLTIQRLKEGHVC